MQDRIVAKALEQAENVVNSERRLRPRTSCTALPPCRSMQGMIIELLAHRTGASRWLGSLLVSSAEADRHALGGQIFFQRADGMFFRVENGGGERRIRSAFAEDVEKIVEFLCAAGSDHGNWDARGDCGGQLAIKSAAGAVAIDGSQQNFSRSARDALLRPTPPRRGQSLRSRRE